MTQKYKLNDYYFTKFGEDNNMRNIEFKIIDTDRLSVFMLAVTDDGEEWLVLKEEIIEVNEKESQ